MLFSLKPFAEILLLLGTAISMKITMNNIKKIALKQMLILRPANRKKKLCVNRCKNLKVGKVSHSKKSDMSFYLVFSFSASQSCCDIGQTGIGKDVKMTYFLE